MSFAYNKNLILEENEELLELVKSIPTQNIITTIIRTLNDEVSIDNLKEEFVEQFKRYSIPRVVTGENIKCFFTITLDGMSKVWENIISDNYEVFESEYPLYENVLEFIDKTIDEIDFDEIFKAELQLLNNNIK
ncbi:MAG: hypothetical protein K0R54_117 [Clostridiaceae bacterium]|jgi:predicted phage-related endonuclease|nr:hypothetical protein [Clostridiaceae bacterium]